MRHTTSISGELMRLLSLAFAAAVMASSVPALADNLMASPKPSPSGHMMKTSAMHTNAMHTNAMHANAMHAKAMHAKGHMMASPSPKPKPSTRP
jgi:hypothetical protein